MEVKLGHSLKNSASLFSMDCGVKGGNEEVIHVDDKPSFGDHVSEGVVHESLEHGRGITKTKEHHSWLKESFVGNEGCFPLMTILDTDVVVSPMNVELGEVVSIFQLVHKIGDERKGVGITGGMFVEVLVVLAGAEFTILLLDKEEEGYLRGVRRTNLSYSKVFFEEILSSFLFIGGEWIYFAYLWYK